MHIQIEHKWVEITCDGRGDILLYRGDRGRIHRFQTGLTRSDNLYGPGIYLTTDCDVAKDYRYKNNSRSLRRNIPKQFIIRGYSKEDVLEKIRQTYFTLIDPFGNYLAKPWKRRISRTHKKLIEYKWEIDKNSFGIVSDGLGVWHAHLASIFPYCGNILG